MRLKRDSKNWKDKFVSGVRKYVGEHIVPRIDRYNSKFAVRLSDIMSLDGHITGSASSRRTGS